jgi:hypothetical protein
MVSLALFVALALPASAQDHLLPDTSAFADRYGYQLKCRHVFAPAFEEGVTLRALVRKSSEKEYVVGLQVRGEGALAFVLEASSSIWDTELLERYETGKIGLARTPDGKAIPLEENATYKDLKKRTPADYRTITPVRRARPLPRDLADGIARLWEVMLLDVQHPKKPEHGRDGAAYYFSAWVQGHGDLSGNIWSPKPESKTGQLGRFTEALANFARGNGSLEMLATQLKAARESITAAAG